MCRNRLCLLLIAILSFTFCDHLGAGEGVAEVDLDELRGGAKVRALVDRVVEHQRALKTMRARFSQHKSSALLLEPAISSGEFFFMAPDQARWNYDVPDAMVVLFSKDTLTTYHPADRVAQHVKIPSKHRRFLRVLAGTQPLDELESQFRMVLSDGGGSSPYRLTLTPTHSALSRKLETVRLEVDRDLMLPISVEYVESDGDSTRYEFQALEIDPPLERSVFTLEFGEDVRIESIDASG